MQYKRDAEMNPRKIHAVRASRSFVIALALVSIIGFIGIVSETLFAFNLSLYVEALLMLVIGIGLIIEGQIKKLVHIRTEGLTPRHFSNLITIIIGVMAATAGIFSIPRIRIESQGFLAVKGIIAIIAIVVIIIQTWIVDNKKIDEIIQTKSLIRNTKSSMRKM